MYHYNPGQYGEWGMMGHLGSWGPEGWLIAALALAAPFIIIAILWSLVWKGLALWHAARRGQYWWFVIMLVINTLGILEIIYLFVVAKLTWRELFSTRSGHDQTSHGHHHSH